MSRKNLVLPVILMSLLSVYANGAWAADKPKEVVFLVESSTFATGTADEQVAKLKAEATQKGINADQQTLDMWRVGFISKFAEIFSKSGYSIRGEDWGWGEPLALKEQNGFLAKSGPDVVIGETQSNGFAVHGYFEPFPAWLDQKVRQLCVKGAYSALEINGKIYGLAAYPGVSALFWNKGLLRKAGLDPEKGPASWDEWLSMENKITAAGKGEFWGGGTYAGPNLGGALRLGPFMMMAGGGFVDTKNNIDFTNPGNIKAFEFIRKLDKNNPPGIAGAPQEGPWWDAFMQQKTAFVVDGPWRMESAKAGGIEVGYSPLPKPKDGIDANVTIGVVFYSVPTYAKNKEGGFRLIETLIDPALQQMIVDFNQRSPVLKSYLNDKKFMSSYLATFYMGLQGQVSCLPTFTGEQSAKIWDVFCQNMTRAIVTDEDIGTIMKNTKSMAVKMQ